MANATAAPSGLAGHPPGLSTLFFTEFWERFSYYGMRAFLMYYMTAAVVTGGLGWPSDRASVLYGLYTASVYFSAIPGGIVADRLLGTRACVVWGGVVIALGHFCLALNTMPSFYTGLVLIVLGTGLLKPNASALVGQLYAEDDPRRDAGFSIYYMGINSGAFVAPIVCSLLAEKVGWHWGFAAAGVGMTVGLAQFLAGRERFGDAGRAPTRSDSPGRFWLILVASMLAGVAVLYRYWDHRNYVILVGTVAFFVWMLTKAAPGVERKRIGAIFVLFVFSVLFWGGFEQAGSSLSLFARDFTDRTVFGWEYPAGWFQTANPAVVVLLAPVLIWVWARLRHHEPSSPAKFALALVFVGLGFVTMSIAANVSGPGGARVSQWWLITTYVFHSIGELCLSPVGLSTVTKLAPARLVGLMMGVWFLALSLGNYIGGTVASYFEILPLPRLFGAVALTTIGSGVVLALLVPPIKRLMAGVR
jgi:POT family proton-dependent oligopeptide transporter